MAGRGTRGGLGIALLATLGACAGATDSAPEPPPIDSPPRAAEVQDAPVRRVPDGDCHKPPGTRAVQLFSAWTPGADQRGASLDGGRVIRTEKYLYAALVPSKDAAGRVAIYRGSAEPGGAWEPYAKGVKDLGPLQFGDRLYFSDRADVTSPLLIAFRGADDLPVSIPGTDNDFSYALDGEIAFTFALHWCPKNDCPLSERISSVNLRTGETVWTHAFDRHGWTALVDGDTLYWTTNWDIATQLQRTRLFSMPKRGGDVVEVPLALDPVNLDVYTLTRDEDGLVLLGLGQRDPKGAAEIIRYRIPANAATPSRTVLGRTYVGMRSAFDRDSVYFTLEGPLGADGNQTQTLMRSCKDGSNPVVVLEGVSINAAPSHLDAFTIDDLAIDDRRVYFTSNNAVYAVDK